MQILETITSAFRGRRMTLAQLQTKPSKSKTDVTVNRWAIYKQLCIAKSVFDVNDRSLAVLSSLLSFYPENDISHKHGLVVFPSNHQLSLRAHGMPESTLRRHLASLVKAGLIARRDSPNGKRYSHKNREGQVEEAFGFSFAPLLERAAEIKNAAEKIQEDKLLLKRTREKITLLRRECAQIIETALEDTPTTYWNDTHSAFRELVNDIPRRATITELQEILLKFVSFHENLSNSLLILDNSQDMSANDAHIERHHYESLTESQYESIPFQKNDLKENTSPKLTNTISSSSNISKLNLSLDMVLRSCPDIREYASNGITNWRDLCDATRTVSIFLGIHQSAYKEAIDAMGIECTSTVIAWILQRAHEIQSAGAYLRSLSQKARAGDLSIGQMLMVLLPKNYTAY